MDDLVQRYLPIVFPVFFVAMWLCVVSILGRLSGWYDLATRYPNQPEPPLMKLRRASGTMGQGVNMSGILNLDACASGLRVGIWKLFGPFSRDFFVPWRDIAVERKNWFGWRFAVLSFGRPTVGRLRLPAYLANRIARAVPGKWPEVEDFPKPTTRQVFTDVAKEWLAVTVLASAFFIVAPRLLARSAAFPPIPAAVLFPAILFGFVFFVRFLWRLER